MNTTTGVQHCADRNAITAELNSRGGGLLPRLLTDAETETIRSRYEDDASFRATVSMSTVRPGIAHEGWSRQGRAFNWLHRGLLAFRRRPAERTHEGYPTECRLWRLWCLTLPQ